MHTLAETYRIADGGLAEYVRRSSAIELAAQAVSASDWTRNGLLEEIGRQREMLLTTARDVLDASSSWQIVRDCQAASEHISQSSSAWRFLRTSALGELKPNGSDAITAPRWACSQAIETQANLASTTADLLCTAADAFNARHISEEAVFSACGQLDAMRVFALLESIAGVLLTSKYSVCHTRALCSPDSLSLNEAYRQLVERDSISEILRSQDLYGADRLWLQPQVPMIKGQDSSHAAIRSRNSPVNERPGVRVETPSVSDIGAIDDGTPQRKSSRAEASEADLPSPPARLEVRAVQIMASLWEAFELAAVPLPDDEWILQESLDLLAVHLVAHHPSHELAILLHVVMVDRALKVLSAPPGPVTFGRTEALNTYDYEIAEEACTSMAALVRRLKRC